MSPQVQFALDQIVFARGYTVKLLDATPTADWFRMPPGGVSHIGWQVGHLAMGQYRWLLERVRGRAESERIGRARRHPRRDLLSQRLRQRRLG